MLNQKQILTSQPAHDNRWIRFLSFHRVPMSVDQCPKTTDGFSEGPKKVYRLNGSMFFSSHWAFLLHHAQRSCRVSHCFHPRPSTSIHFHPVAFLAFLATRGLGRDLRTHFWWPLGPQGRWISMDLHGFIRELGEHFHRFGKLWSLGMCCWYFCWAMICWPIIYCRYSIVYS